MQGLMTYGKQDHDCDSFTTFTSVTSRHLEKKGCNEEGFLESDMSVKRANMNQ